MAAARYIRMTERQLCLVDALTRHDTTDSRRSKTG